MIRVCCTCMPSSLCIESAGTCLHAALFHMCGWVCSTCLTSKSEGMRAYVYVHACLVLFCSFSLHNKGWEFNFAKDQTQAVVVSLLNLASCAVRSVPAFIQQCKQQTAMTICRHYKSPYTLLVSALYHNSRTQRM